VDPDAAGDGGRDLPPRRVQAPEEELQLGGAGREATQGGVRVAGEKPAAVPPPPVAPPPVPRAPQEPQIHIAGSAPPDPLSETRLRSVYRAYVEAKRRCNEDTTRLSFDAVAASLKKQVPELLDRHKVRDVEYRVFVKDGKAILRAVPKV